MTAGGNPAAWLAVGPAQLDELAPALAAAGCRMQATWLRGYEAAAVLRRHTPRSRRPAALGAIFRDFLDGLGIEHVSRRLRIVGGYRLRRRASGRARTKNSIAVSGASLIQRSRCGARWTAEGAKSWKRHLAGKISPCPAPSTTC
jgi:hypothetical protein